VATVADRMTERQLEDAVRALLKVHGLWGYHTADSRGSQPGWPDWVILGRTVLYRELKTSEGQLSPAQSRVRNLLRVARADWGIWRPADLASGRIDRELRALKL
jgi:hypothetical protein